ncbi:NrfA- nitrite reduction protein [Arenicella chitinivorans]|uniref:nitrite reductase (cytochrome; ammonia-forming) n=1 Tax=Arenicella chitinivorans TaxID=1329800 RepID=A0A918RK36_9GAMM|nr:cytochrome c3 family protein [Arenicella chitinivorans]GHA00260.1 NrfA- nitrite reduction protein [Arenicella chitinivorans]
MRFFQRVGFLQYGAAVTLLLSAFLGYNLFVGGKDLFLPGSSTKGHHQIEAQCDVCHATPFDTDDAMQQACLSCHSDALQKARDTHPMKKFTDPRNADLLASLDATQCVTCHIEHSPEVTGQFGVTLPPDFCYYCHQQIAEERPSHEEFEFNTCGNAGCHNFHDNKALYESFLAKHIDKPALLSEARLRVPNAFAVWQQRNPDAAPLPATAHDGSEIPGTEPALISAWQSSLHAQVGANCSSCHANPLARTDSTASSWRSGHDLSVASCTDCHTAQVDGFKQGLHGMRLASELPPLKVSDARLPMHTDAAHKSLTCSSCHDPHQPDLQFAATEACLGCHADEHSLNYTKSAHSTLWRQEVAGQVDAGVGVSCASCHMPRIKKGKLVSVEHNQSLTLEPNSKMIRPVCLECHGLEYSIAALSDRNLIRRNFSGAFDATHPSFALVRERIAAKKAQKQRARATKSNQ